MDTVTKAFQSWLELANDSAEKETQELLAWLTANPERLDYAPTIALAALLALAED